MFCGVDCGQKGTPLRRVTSLVFLYTLKKEAAEMLCQGASFKLAQVRRPTFSGHSRTKNA